MTGRINLQTLNQMGVKAHVFYGDEMTDDHLVEGYDNIYYYDNRFVNKMNEVVMPDDLIKDFTLDDKGNQIDPTTNEVIKSSVELVRELLKVEPKDYKPPIDPAKKDDPKPPADAPVISFDTTKGNYFDDKGNPMIDAATLANIKFNEHGDHINEAGEIITTRAEILDRLTKGDEPTDQDIISELSKVLDYELVDETGKPISFDNSIAGVSEYVKTIVQKETSLAQEQAVSIFLKANPDIYDMALYKQLHGTLEGYAKEVDWAKYEIDKDDKDQMKSVIRKAELIKNKGSEDTYIDDIIDALDAKGKLEEASKSALGFIQAHYSSIEETRNKTIKDREDAKEQARVNMIEGYKNVITQGKLELNPEVVINIPNNIARVVDGKVITASKQDFLNYITTPSFINTETGQKLTGFERDFILMDDAKKLSLYYMVFLNNPAEFTKQMVANAIRRTSKNNLFNDAPSFLFNTPPKPGEGGKRTKDTIKTN